MSDIKTIDEHKFEDEDILRADLLPAGSIEIYLTCEFNDKYIFLTTDDIKALANAKGYDMVKQSRGVKG